MVLEGRATIEWAGGSVEVGPGDLCCFAAGTETVWTVHEALLKGYSLALLASMTIMCHDGVVEQSVPRGGPKDMELTSSLAKRRIFSGVAAAGLATAVAVFAFGPEVKADPPTQTTSVVLISGDGMGVQQRTAIQYANYGIDERQPMDSLPYAGFLDTIQDGNTAVTDSAAGATAWSIGVKTKNGLVGLGRDKVRVPTLMEIAEVRGQGDRHRQRPRHHERHPGRVRGTDRQPRLEGRDRAADAQGHLARRDDGRRRGLLVPARRRGDDPERGPGRGPEPRRGQPGRRGHRARLRVRVRPRDGR